MSTENSYLFSCYLCDLYTNYKKDYENHLLTRKHLKAINVSTKNPNIDNKFICNNCNKEYNCRSGLWRHNQKCKINKNNNDNNIILSENSDNNILNPIQKSDNEIKTLTELVIEVVKNNNEFQKQIFDLIKNTNNINMNNCNNNNNNQTFNLHLFLNETCKDAMNMSEFINSFNLQMSDLERLADDGYVKTMSNLIVNKVRELDVEKRPLHCTDAKREMFYIKEDNTWIKDDEKKSHLRKAVNKIGIKNISVLQDWQQEHPNCIKANSPYNNTYLKMMKEVMGGSDIIGNENKVIKNIIKEVVIDKQQYLI